LDQADRFELGVILTELNVLIPIGTRGYSTRW
jgi:hypothetical protein